jgi:hypothetical protein
LAIGGTTWSAPITFGMEIATVLSLAV